MSRRRKRKAWVRGKQIRSARRWARYGFTEVPSRFGFTMVRRHRPGCLCSRCIEERVRGKK